MASTYQTCANASGEVAADDIADDSMMKNLAGEMATAVENVYAALAVNVGQPLLNDLVKIWFAQYCRQNSLGWVGEGLENK